ncbi:MAG TPA: PhoH family protein, partial [Hyphomonadaceae bacterium]|nr:PhoH family protein [Hyphomonadaceae bacterium]
MSAKPKQTRTHRYTVPISSPQLLRDICGPAHSHLQLLEHAFADDNVRADSQGQSGEIVVTGTGDGARVAADSLQAFANRIANGAEPTAAELEAAIRLTISRIPVSTSGDVIGGLRKPIMAQTPGQRAYLDKLRLDDLGLIFGVGPAGTGKTVLAVAVGAAELKSGKRERLIVARP